MFLFPVTLLVSALPWLWFCHLQAAFLFSLFERHRLPHQPGANASPRPEIALLYTSCDDFDETACLSCVRQSYAGTFRVLICDDSESGQSRRRIDAFARAHGISVIRRKGRRDFKAGNLNHAIGTAVEEPVFAVSDADAILPPDFLARMTGLLAADGRIGFVQAAHRHRREGSTGFGNLMGIGIGMMYRHVFGARNAFGFVPCFGHGIVVRTATWREAGGFPSLMSEDLAFSARALAAGYRGWFAGDVICQEWFPQNYAAMVSHITRVARGGVQFWVREGTTLTDGRRIWGPELVDLLITFSTCFFPILTVLNLLLGLATARWILTGDATSGPAWLIPIVFLGPLSPALSLLVWTGRHPLRAIGFLSLAAAAYGGSVPALAWATIRQLLRAPEQSFVPTGSIGRGTLPAGEVLARTCAGAALLGIGAALPPPHSGFSTLFAIVVGCSPLLGWLGRDRAAR